MSSKELNVLTRRQIEFVCSHVPPVPALDKYSSAEATKVFVTRLAKQLEGKSIRKGGLNQLVDYVVKRHTLSCLRDYTFSGLQAEESISVELAQASQDAFKVVVKTTVISNVVSAMKDITETVRDRKSPMCIVHLDKSYARGGYNFTRTEVVSMRSIFVRTTLKDLFATAPVIGILKPFPGDQVSVSMRRLREKCMEHYYCAELEPGVWNRLTAIYKDNAFRGAILALRFRLDPASIYSRNMTMKDIANAITSAVSEVSDYRVAASVSSIVDATIDVCVSKSTDAPYEEDGLTKFEAELLVLDRDVRKRVGEYSTGGIPGVQAMSVNTVNLVSLMKPSKPSDHHLCVQGKRKWIEDNRLEDLRDEQVRVVSIEDLHQDDVILYKGNEVAYIYYPYEDELPEPAEMDLDRAYAEYLTQGKSIWLLELAATTMKSVGVAYHTEIQPLLDFCGVEVVHVANHELMDLPYYVYVRSDENPVQVIKVRVRDHENVATYTYAALSLSRKNYNKQEQYYHNLNVAPYVSHVVKHALPSILRVPFIDRHRTYTNDWFTNTYALGVDCARNIYVGELFNLMSASSGKDPRHFELFGDVVFSRGYPAGASQKTSDEQGRGAISQLGTDKQKQQLSKSFNKEPEGLQSVDVATFFGAPPIPGLSAARNVAAKTATERRRREVIWRQERKTAPLESSLEIHTRALRSAADPFSVINDISTPRYFPNIEGMGDTLINTVLDTPLVVKGSTFLQRVIEGAAEQESLLAEMRPYLGKVVPITIPDSAHTVDLTKILSFLRTHLFE